MAGMPYLDSNILLRWVKPDHNDYPLVVSAIEAILRGDGDLCYTVTDRTVFPRRCQLIFLADSRIPMPLDRPTVLTEQASGIGYSPV